MFLGFKNCLELEYVKSVYRCKNVFAKTTAKRIRQPLNKYPALDILRYCCQLNSVFLKLYATAHYCVPRDTQVRCETFQKKIIPLLRSGNVNILLKCCK